jgi:hypothetical protein
MLPRVSGVEILSVTKPIATKDHVCAWDSHHVIKTGQLHVRAVWKDRRVNKENPTVNSDRVCISCWTKD